MLEKCVDGAKVAEICEYGDQQIVDATTKVYKKEKDIKKGLFIKYNSLGKN